MPSHRSSLPHTTTTILPSRRKSAERQWFKLNADSKKKKDAGEIELKIELRATVAKARERGSSTSGRRPSYVSQYEESDSESEGEEEEEERKQPTPEEEKAIEEEQVRSSHACMHTVKFCVVTLLSGTLNKY